MKRLTRTAAPTEIRCAIYTRKSTEEGLQQEFNTLDAQRESAEAFIQSQQHEGWACVPARYDDGGFSGGTMDRPGLRRLLADIEAGQIDVVVVYKVDRLSRSLLDFARLMEVFDRQRVSFVSVTQQFNTTHSMGRLTLHILLSFAQFEREIISERTRDKIAATRRRGKWSGGRPILGYDVDHAATKLIVNADEAVRVRAIFDLYLERQSLQAVLKELHRRDWRNKRWTTRSGEDRGGAIFDKSSLHKLLTNPLYVGVVRYKTERHVGEHPAIVDAETFGNAQALLQRNSLSGGAEVRNKHGALLKGLLFCKACQRAMTPACTSKRGARLYRYYTCTNAQKLGWETCPSKSVPAGEIERFVVQQIQDIAQDAHLLDETLAQVQAQTNERLRELEAEERILKRDLAQAHAEVRRLCGEASAGAKDGPVPARLADLHDRIRVHGHRAAEAKGELDVLASQKINADDVAHVLSDFQSLWSTLTPREQCRLIQLVIERVEFDAPRGTVALTFHSTGIRTLMQQANAAQEIA